MALFEPQHLLIPGHDDPEFIPDALRGDVEYDTTIWTPMLEQSMKGASISPLWLGGISGRKDSTEWLSIRNFASRLSRYDDSDSEFDSSSSSWSSSESDEEDESGGRDDESSTHDSDQGSKKHKNNDKKKGTMKKLVEMMKKRAEKRKEKKRAEVAR